MASRSGFVGYLPARAGRWNEVRPDRPWRRCSRVRTAMAQQIADLGQGRSLLEHLGRQAGAKQVRGSISRLNARSFQCPVHQRAAGETDQRRYVPDEYAKTGTMGSELAQIGGHRRACFDRLGH